MKIYFTASVSQAAQFGSAYQRIVATLLKTGATVQHEHITEKKLDEIKTQSPQEVSSHYKQVTKWIANADLVVVEASFPSTLNIGHEITLSLEKGKPVIVLYKEGFETLFLSGLNSDKLIMAEYSDDTLEQVLTDSLTYAKDSADSRFNFFISPRHISYLDWVAKVKKIPRSVYLRQLIEHDRDQNQEYQNE